ncbi:MAG: acetoacetate decarboxylase family protein [Rhodococcus sp. (in: high G+C Gram-positive bacteria)]
MLERPQFLTDRLGVRFLTTHAFIEEVLPPGLEPSDAPVAIASMSRCQSDVCGPFNFAAIYLSCKFGDLEGIYGLWMATDGDLANQIGRDMWGEAKKVGEVQIYQEPHGMSGRARRNGTDLISIEADLDVVPADEEILSFVGFELKGQPDASGRGLEYDPRLVAMYTHDSVTTKRVGTASLTLNGTVDDPLDTIPIVEVLGATNLVADSHSTAEVLASYPDHDRYVPYIYGRNFDSVTSQARPRLYRRPSLSTVPE